MSDHIVGSEEYYLDRIDNTLARFVDSTEERQTDHNNMVARVLDGMRDLLNLENEAMTMLRDIRREKDNERIERAEKDFTFLVYDLVQWSHSPLFLDSYVQRLEVPQLKLFGETLQFYLKAITGEIKRRADNVVKTAKLLDEEG